MLEIAVIVLAVALVAVAAVVAVTFYRHFQLMQATLRDREEALMTAIDAYATKNGSPLKTDQGPIYGERVLHDGTLISDDGTVTEPGHDPVEMGELQRDMLKELEDREDVQA